MEDGPGATGFETDVDADAADLTRSRHQFEQWLDRLGLADDTGDELAVVFSELTSNAANATGAAAPATHVKAWVDRRDVVIEVANPLGAEGPRRIEADLDDPLRSGGRGLLIVRAYTDDLQIDAVADIVSIRCRRHLRADELPLR